MKKSTTILVLLSFIFFTCRKEENNFGLPPATQQGANTFGCLIDGKPWVAEIGLGVLDPLIKKLCLIMMKWDLEWQIFLIFH